MLSTGQCLLSFEIHTPLGAGGMGEVYRARDISLDREVALKVLPPRVAEDRAVRRRFAREAKTLATLNHPHVAQIYGYHENDDVCFLSLEFVDGEDLSDRLRNGPIAIDEVIAIGSQIAAGLEAAHKAGVVHRDLKPANIRITPGGNAKILDFGLAKLSVPSLYDDQSAGESDNLEPTIDSPITKHGAILGTPFYMSPEQARGLATDHRTDIWAFGCVLYECLTGKRAFDGPSIADVFAAVLGSEPNWNALPTSTPASVAALLQNCLAKELNLRLADLSEARLQLSGANNCNSVTFVSSSLARARAACESRQWQTAFDLLSEADERGELEPEGMELLAECARWLGRNDDIFDPLERAHAQHVARGARGAALRTALALCHANDDAGRKSLTEAWWERADELIVQIPEGPEHAAHAWFQSRAHGAQGDLEKQEKFAGRALELARRFGERSIEALALIDLAHVATVRGDHATAVDRIRHATSLALGGEINLFATGMVYCNAIWACRCRGDWQRAQEWTESSTRWINRQHIEYFPGMCRVHRAEVLRIRGDLAAAEKECEAATRMVSKAMPAYATFPWAELGEVRRRRGNLSGAMNAFQESLSLGWDPQPGLALLIMQQGDAVSAHRSIERAFREPRPTMMSEDRANLLCARTTLAISVNAMATAESAVSELAKMAAQNETPWDSAAAAHTRGMFELASGKAGSAVDHLTRARRIWGELNAPYELATTCVLLGRALAADGDRSQAELELKAARDVFARIGAELDRERTDEILADLKVEQQVIKAKRSDAQVRASMYREGDTWAIAFQGRTVRFNSTRGLEHLATLLSQPGVDCWAIDLAGAGGAADRGDAGETIDAAARDAYRRRAQELEQELADIDSRTNPLEAERIRTEMDAIAREIAASVGIGGRVRRTGSAVERARQSVTKSIRTAIRKVAEVHPELGRYFEVTIKTGTACQFDPSRRELVQWSVDP